MPGDQILVDALGAQSEFEHRRDDLLEIRAQAARAGDHFGGALWCGEGVALYRAAVDAQRAGNAADRPALGCKGLNGLLLGHFEDVGHAPPSKAHRLCPEGSGLPSASGAL